MRKTGIVWEPVFIEHIMSAYHPESPARLLGVKEILDKTAAGKNTIHIKAREATHDELAAVHEEEYIKYIAGTKGKTVFLDPDTTACPKTYEAALMAAGGTMECVKAVMDGKVDNAFAFVRPPGHHAESFRAMGFCIFNNVAVAAEYAVRQYNLKKVMIIDFDVHHGNGTQNTFYDRSDVFYISTHRFPFYPGSGDRNDHGIGGGKGFTLNIPFEANTGEEEFKKVYRDIVMPIIDEYKPELLLVSAGYDAHRDDPMGGINIGTSTYNWLMKELLLAADRVCNGKLVVVLEGGYNISAIKECVEGALEVLGT